MTEAEYRKVFEAYLADANNRGEITDDEEELIYELTNIDLYDDPPDNTKIRF